jgi:hypothetical protein
MYIAKSIIPVDRGSVCLTLPTLHSLCHVFLLYGITVPPECRVSQIFIIHLEANERQNYELVILQFIRHEGQSCCQPHDNPPAHMCLKTIQFVTNKNMVIIPHPPYLSNLDPVISPFCPPKLKN